MALPGVVVDERLSVEQLALAVHLLLDLVAEAL